MITSFCGKEGMPKSISKKNSYLCISQRGGGKERGKGFGDNWEKGPQPACKDTPIMTGKEVLAIKSAEITGSLRRGGAISQYILGKFKSERNHVGKGLISDQEGRFQKGRNSLGGVGPTNY